MDEVVSRISKKKAVFMMQCLLAALSTSGIGLDSVASVVAPLYNELIVLGFLYWFISWPELIGCLEKKLQEINFEIHFSPKQVKRHRPMRDQVFLCMNG